MCTDVSDSPNVSQDATVNAAENASSSSNCSQGVAKVVGVLPGLGVYTDSDDSDSSSSESDIDTDLLKRDHISTKSGHEVSTSSGSSHRHR